MVNVVTLPLVLAWMSQPFSAHAVCPAISAMNVSTRVRTRLSFLVISDFIVACLLLFYSFAILGESVAKITKKSRKRCVIYNNGV
jgi:hypothetical protein